MLLKETLEIVKKLLAECEVNMVTIAEAEEIIHYGTEEPEFDIRIEQNLNHNQIQAIDEILSGFSNVEMKLVHGKGLIIFEAEKEED